VIALIDYGAGNLTSVKKALATVGARVFVPAQPGDLTTARGIIVPGVGHFGATRTLDSPWVTAVRARVDEGCPLLGICLGMQWLYEASDEAPELNGLGILPGRCYRLEGVAQAFRPADAGLKSRVTIKVPHVGWNSLTLTRSASITEGVPSGAQVYFTHSYAAPVSADTVAVTDHGEPFAAVVERGRVAGVQFHPEKSGDVGLRILRNFVLLTSNF
jgi:imidazole glycerol-phosphate synthase subunit HisH